MGLLNFCYILYVSQQKILLSVCGLVSLFTEIFNLNLLNSVLLDIKKGFKLKNYQEVKEFKSNSQ